MKRSLVSQTLITIGILLIVAQIVLFFALSKTININTVFVPYKLQLRSMSYIDPAYLKAAFLSFLKYAGAYACGAVGMLTTYIGIKMPAEHGDVDKDKEISTAFGIGALYVGIIGVVLAAVVLATSTTGISSAEKKIATQQDVIDKITVQVKELDNQLNAKEEVTDSAYKHPNCSTLYNSMEDFVEKDNGIYYCPKCMSEFTKDDLDELEEEYEERQATAETDKADKEASSDKDTADEK